MAALKGTPQERREQKADRRRTNEINHVRRLAESAQTGHERVVAATQAAKSASRRMTEAAQQQMAYALAQVVERFDVAANWKEDR